ncbi:MAG: alpha/beta hydrolase fold domain-containing protein [Lewinellaceae bacterium]|nr:alpha/beta hydrolase fold domain-containing protein [Lewinellaceae bacterium]
MANHLPLLWWLWIFIIPLSCQENNPETDSGAFRETRMITYNQVQVAVVIDKPAYEEVDVILAFHGTVFEDSKILQAANTTLDAVRRITDRADIMIVSVAYPEEGLLMGDNIRESEAALLWMKNKATIELGVRIRKVFLVGHSQGGYIVTRLNTMYATDGVVANGPGPLNLALRCQLEEDKKVQPTTTCMLLQDKYGQVMTNPEAYLDRSLLRFTNGFQADILFCQGMQDAAIQLSSWPAFKQSVMDCRNCRGRQFVEIVNGGHTALFESPEAKLAYNQFIDR